MTAEPEYRLDWMISVDDHVLEPPNVWQDRVPAKYKDAAPKIVVKDGQEAWQYEGRIFPTSGLAAVAGKNAKDISPHALNYADMRPGCYEPTARVDDMDEAGLGADGTVAGLRLHLGRQGDLDDVLEVPDVDPVAPVPA